MHETDFMYTVIRPTGDLVTTDYHDSELLCKSTISMHSMLMLGGSEGMPRRKILKNRCSKIEFGGIYVLSQGNLLQPEKLIFAGKLRVI